MQNNKPARTLCKVGYRINPYTVLNLYRVNQRSSCKHTLLLEKVTLAWTVAALGDPYSNPEYTKLKDELWNLITDSALVDTNCTMGSFTVLRAQQKSFFGNYHLANQLLSLQTCLCI